MAIKAGIVFNFLQLPDVSQFPFVISKRIDNHFVQKGLFVYTQSSEGFLIGIIERIILLNEYFSDALTIKAYNTNNNPNILKGLFHSDCYRQHSKFRRSSMDICGSYSWNYGQI